MLFIPARYTTTKSLLLNGTTQSVSVGNIAAMNFTGTTAFSVTAWIKHTSFSAASIIISKMGGVLASNSGWIFYTGISGQLRFLIGGPTGSILVSTTTFTSVGTWQHVAVTYSGSGLASGVTIYINGVAQPTVTNTDTYSTSAANSADVRIGARADNSLFFPGNLYAVTPWSAALSGANITALYNAGVPLDSRLSAASASIIAYYRCGNDPIDDGTGTTGVIMDRSGNHNGTPQGTVAGDIVTDAP